MAGSKGGGATIELQKQSFDNFKKQMNKLEKMAPEKAFKGLVTLLFDIKTLAQQKLKSDRHIKTSRLRNSLYVKTLGQKFANRSNNKDSFSADGKSYSSDFQVNLKENEGAIGTNVEYGPAIEFGYGAHTIEAKNFPVLGNKKVGFFGKKVNHPGFAGDSFLYWALKNVDTDKRGREVAKEILNGIT
ncbi:MAG: hypothetical protein BV456_13010 [Thermoplasmata archaeon M8B2D]|nr:MAG: hypothetical protein BV456_13010 [Thermoplasmata archaeon M8B2D]